MFGKILRNLASISSIFFLKKVIFKEALFINICLNNFILFIITYFKLFEIIFLRNQDYLIKFCKFQSILLIFIFFHFVQVIDFSGFFANYSNFIAF